LRKFNAQAVDRVILAACATTLLGLGIWGVLGVLDRRTYDGLEREAVAVVRSATPPAEIDAASLLEVLGRFDDLDEAVVEEVTYQGADLSSSDDIGFWLPHRDEVIALLGAFERAVLGVGAGGSGGAEAELGLTPLLRLNWFFRLVVDLDPTQRARVAILMLKVSEEWPVRGWLGALQILRMRESALEWIRSDLGYLGDRDRGVLCRLLEADDAWAWRGRLLGALVAGRVRFLDAVRAGEEPWLGEGPPVRNSWGGRPGFYRWAHRKLEPLVEVLKSRPEIPDLERLTSSGDIELSFLAERLLHVHRLSKNVRAIVSGRAADSD
jgi:hypothetical protein